MQCVGFISDIYQVKMSLITLSAHESLFFWDQSETLHQHHLVCDRVISGGWRFCLTQISSHASHQSMATHIVFHHLASVNDGFHVSALGALKNAL